MDFEEKQSSSSSSDMTSAERGYKLWRGPLKSARLIVAPMVDASELPWRMLSRKYGAELCYTPMLHSSVFVKDARYRRENLVSCSEDRPLIVQFCANDPDIFVEACRLAAPYCDAVDLNLGCPQAIARKGHYGSFLQDEWQLLEQMVRRATEETGVPITAKIRVFPDLSKTVKYGQMLEGAGACILTVHGRTREQKGPLTGIASWEHIRAVKEAVNVPVFANGNIQYFKDIERCIQDTGVEGVMTAEGNLHNPALLADLQPPVWEVVLEYLQLVRTYPCPLSYSRGHVFKILHHCLGMKENYDLRYQLSKASDIDSMVDVAEKLRDKYFSYHQGKKWLPSDDSVSNLPQPPWICQPYVRIPPKEHLQKMTESQLRAQTEKEESKTKQGSNKREGFDDDEHDSAKLSKKKQKKLQRNPRKNFNPPPHSYEKCICKNPKGGRCSFSLCRSCCKLKCFREELDCTGHKILVKTRKEKAIRLTDQENKMTESLEVRNNQENIISVYAVGGKDSEKNENMMNKNLPENKSAPQFSEGNICKSLTTESDLSVDTQSVIKKAKRNNDKFL